MATGSKEELVDRLAADDKKKAKAEAKAEKAKEDDEEETDEDPGANL